MSTKWIECKIKEMFKNLFPRTIIASHGVGPSKEGFLLKKGASYNAIGVTKHGNRWMYILNQKGKEITWGADHFN